MRYQDKPPGGDAAAAAETPRKCPVCGATDLTTTSKVVTAASYWRCTACGEVWNVARLSAASRYVGYGSWRR